MADNDRQDATPAPAATPDPLCLSAAYDLGIRYDNLRYGLGDKGLNGTRIDCAGWVLELQNATMTEINRQSGQAIFDRSDRFTTATSAQMIERTVNRSGVMLTSPITRDQLREGMIIGEDNGQQSWEPRGRYHGIDHITMVVRNPTSGELMISQSRGGEGVEMVPIDAYLARQGQTTRTGATRTFVATDPLAEARPLLQGGPVATNATPAPGRADAPPANGTAPTPDAAAATPQRPAAPSITDAHHPNHALYAAIGGQLPAGTRPEAVANVTLQAIENGITAPDRLRSVMMQGNDVFVTGTTPGFRARVDIEAATPSLQAMSDRMGTLAAQAQTQTPERQQRVAQP